MGSFCCPSPVAEVAYSSGVIVKTGTITWSIPLQREEELDMEEESDFDDWSMYW
jgi:hypothetical protein